ncbi:hypothetical protein EX30DRAFT_394291 [Ascodesmis nigricans]|uniref:Bromo domain-containing protein n=1 Tax=Ascodesmis nigricans TaxID=341454 RepID=A0A4S2N229_9PEZI|nr:hypothetical protein EX30DRAFT_394291 [Ascodesmis nigricans]
MPSSTHDFTYTALEQLLLFHTLSSAHPIQSSTFVHVSNTLLKHPAVRADDTFDRGRLSPEALRERFTWLLREFNKTGDLGSIRTMATEMYDEYKRGIVRDIREDERRFLAVKKEIKEIEEGKWDEKLLKEWGALNANKNVLKTAKAAVSRSPAPEKSLLIRSPRPEKEKPVKKDKKEQEKESEKEKRAKAAASLPLKVNELVHKRPPGPPPVRPDVIPHPVQQRPREDGIPLGREALSVGSMQGRLQQPPHSLDLGLQAITPSIPSAPVSAIRGEPAPTPSPHAPVPPTSHIRHSDAPTGIRAFAKAPVLTPNKPSLGHPASPSPTLTPTPLPPNHHPAPSISRVHQVSPHRQTSASPGPQHQFQPQHSPIRRQPLPTPIAIQPQQARWQQKILQPSQPPPPQISPTLPPIQPHYSPRPQSPHGQIPVSGHPYGPAHQSAPRTPVGAYFPHPQATQPGSPAFQHSHQQIVRSPVVPYQSSPYGVYQQPIHRSPAPPFAHVPPLQSGQSTPMQVSPRRHPPPPATDSPFTPVVTGYPPPNPGSPRQPGPEDISPISTPPSSPRPEKATLSPLKIVENPRPNKRPLEQSPHETNTPTKDKKPPAKRQRSSMKAQKPYDIPQDIPAVTTGLPTIPDSVPPGERSISPVGEVASPTPGRSRGKPLSTPKTAPPRIRPRGRGKGGATTPGRENASSESPKSTSPSLEKAQVSPSKPEEPSKATHSEPVSAVSTPATIKRRPGPIAKANLIIPPTGNAPSTPASPLKRKRAPTPAKPSVNGDVTDDDNLPTLEQMAEWQKSPKKVDLPRSQVKKQPPPKPTPISTTSGSSVSGASPAGLNAPPLVAVGQQPMVVATKKFTTLTAPLLANISGHRYANLFSAPVIESRAPGYRELIRRPQDLKSIKAAIRAGTLFVQSLDTNPSTAATPTRSTPPVFPSAPSISTPYLPTSSTATSITMPATTLNTPPKGIVNSLQLEKELFRMFANAVMYNKTNTEIVKETNIMAKDVEAMVTNFRGAEEVGTRKALAAKEKEGPQWGGRRTLFQREGTDDRTQGAARDREAGKDGEKGNTGEGGDEEDDGKSETVTTTEEPAHVPRKRGRPKRRKDDEATA